MGLIGLCMDFYKIWSGSIHTGRNHIFTISFNQWRGLDSVSGRISPFAIEKCDRRDSLESRFCLLHSFRRTWQIPHDNRWHRPRLCIAVRGKKVQRTTCKELDSPFTVEGLMQNFNANSNNWPNKRQEKMQWKLLHIKSDTYTFPWGFC